MKTLLNVFVLGIFLTILPSAVNAVLPESSSSLKRPVIYYTGPLPKLNIIPTLQSLEYRGLEFRYTAKHLSFMLSSHENELRYANIKTIVMDYGFKTADKVQPKLPKNVDDVIDYKWFVPMSDRYFFTLRFYNVEPKDINKKNAVINLNVLLFSKMKISPIEAFQLMLREGFQTLEDAPDENNIFLELD